MKYSSQYKPLTLDLFKSSFDGLNKSNRWVILGDNLPWGEIEKTYNSRLDNKYKGAGNKPARMIIGAMIVKHKLNLSDEETIEMIQENPYMQYLCGLSEFTDKPLFDPSLFVTIRKRISMEEINEITTSLLQRELKRKEEARKLKESQDNVDGNEPTPQVQPDDNGVEFTDEQGRKHKGILKIDATCADAEVRFPVDVDIIHDGCKVVDRYLTTLCKSLGIPLVKSSYKTARRFYLELVKRKKKGGKLVKETISHLLHYLKVDLRKITEIFVEHRGSKALLQPHEQRTLNATFDMFAQQSYMHENNVHVCANRIISIFQPHLRPIKRGKARAKTEFGAKIGAAIYEGYTFIDHHSWDAYNENTDLKLQVEKFKERFGYLPATIHADKIYLNKVNRQYLKDEEIKSYCKPLGRPSKESKTPEFIAKMTQAVGERNEIECSFGTGKRIYRANNIRAKLPDTSECWAGMCYFVKNVMKFLRGLCLVFFQIWLIWRYFTNLERKVRCAQSLAKY